MNPVTKTIQASMTGAPASVRSSARTATKQVSAFSITSNFELQSSFDNSLKHIAIIMDGNRRWASQRGLTASAGHRAGAEALQTIIEALSDTQVSTLSVFGFSQLNWQRPTFEVRQLFELIGEKLADVGDTCRERELRVEFIGRRDRLPHALVTRMQALEARTDCFPRCVRIAIDYSGRSAIAVAASGTSSVDPSLDGFEEQLRMSQQSQAISANNVDLLIRTGGEQRLSDFLLWESAFAELRFEECYWPDYSSDHLKQAIADFESRHRRFGR